MPVYIHDIATSVPEAYSSQKHIMEVIKSRVADDRKTKAILHRIYTQSGIEKRHSVLGDFSENKEGNFFSDGNPENIPGTGDRNAVYEKESKKLFIDVAQKLISQSDNFNAEDITHVITASCTGFFAPGPDFEIVKALKLPASTQRFHVGFMGCYAAFPGMKMAKAFCESDPDAVVMVICAELCTLHFQQSKEVDHLLSGSVFGDGASGVLISGKKPSKEGFEIEGFVSAIAEKSEEDMAWTIGNHGFNMVLSTYVPEIIRQNIADVVKPIYEQYSIQKEDIDYWAVHPGGRAILDKIEQGLSLEKEQVSSSRAILAEFGNMSSATVLFVLKNIVDSGLEDGAKVLPISFGPGLTIESGLLTFRKS